MIDSNEMVLRVGELNLVARKTGDAKQWEMTIDEAARGYDVDSETIVSHLKRHADEIREGVERGSAICTTPGGPQKKTVLYREGIIKLGFFIKKSSQAKAFRQTATDTLVAIMDGARPAVDALAIAQIVCRAIGAALSPMTAQLVELTNRLAAIEGAKPTLDTNGTIGSRDARQYIRIPMREWVDRMRAQGPGRGVRSLFASGYQELRERMGLAGRVSFDNLPHSRLGDATNCLDAMMKAVRRAETDARSTRQSEMPWRDEAKH